MNCPEASELVHAYSDGELDLARALEVEKHLADCEACRRVHGDIKDLKTTIKSGDHYFKAPSGLERDIHSSLFGKADQKRQKPVFAWWQLFKLALPVAGAAFVVAFLIPVLFGRSADSQLAQEVTAGHIRSLMADHRTDVASSDQHTVKPWFAGKLDFTPMVVDLAAHGFPLVGGRLDYLNNRPVAALVYQRHQHLINLFIWPASTDSKKAEKIVTRRGYNLVHWTASGMTFWAISDLNAAELKEFVHLLK